MIIVPKGIVLGCQGRRSFYSTDFTVPVVVKVATMDFNERCPFCGARCTTLEVNGCRAVVCSNENCFVRPYIKAPFGVVNSLENAMSLWNMRQDSIVVTDMLPCPFCGDYCESYIIQNKYSFKCCKVGCPGHNTLAYYDRIEDAMEAWNMRFYD